MKKLFLLLFIICSCVVYAQNLVPNPSFEDTVHCPYDIGQINFATGWYSCNEGDPEYYNACDTTNNWGVPYNGWGYQYTPDSNCSGYCGLYTFDPWSPNFREFIGIHLLSPLSLGIRYYCSMKVSLCEVSECASNNLGFLFSTIPFSYYHPAPVENFAHFYNPNILTDKIDWTTVSGSFIADSAYNFICVGNFFDDIHTDTLCINGSGSLLPYYYIDDICVSTDSAFCSNYTYTCGNGISENNLIADNINLFPNPASDYIQYTISDPYKDCMVSILNPEGSIIYNRKNTFPENTISLTGIAAGVYFVRFAYNDKTVVRKLVVIK